MQVKTEIKGSTGNIGVGNLHSWEVGNQNKNIREDPLKRKIKIKQAKEK